MVFRFLVGECPHDAGSDAFASRDLVDFLEPKRIKGAVCKKRDARGSGTALHADQFQPLHLVESKLKRGLGKPRPRRDLLLRGVATPALIGFAGHRASDAFDMRV
jgi:hypothetical protein